MRFASTSSSIAAAGAGPALPGAVCAAAQGSQYSSPATAAQVKRIMQSLPGCAIAARSNASSTMAAGSDNRSRRSLLRRDAGGLDDLRPAFQLALDEGVELLRRAADDVGGL